MEIEMLQTLGALMAGYHLKGQDDLVQGLIADVEKAFGKDTANQLDVEYAAQLASIGIA